MLQADSDIVGNSEDEDLSELTLTVADLLMGPKKKSKHCVLSNSFISKVIQKPS